MAMGGHAPTQHHGHWYHDPGVRLLIIALAIVLAVFLIAFTVMTENVGGEVAAILGLVPLP
jgi:hypothetical protein